MNKYLLGFLLILIGLLSWIGFQNLNTIANQNNKIRIWEQDSIKTHQFQQKNINLYKNIQPKDGLIQLSNKVAPLNTSNTPYLSAAQGVEVHLEGIRWNGTWFKKGNSAQHGIEKLGGVSDIQINQIVFDPDFPKSGMPDLNVEVTSPKIFKFKNFMTNWLGGSNSNSFISKLVNPKKAIETFDLETTPGKKIKMAHWLVEFDTFLRIEPSPDHTSLNIGNLKYHPISKQSTRSIRYSRESKNQRYGNVSVMLKFTPKKGSWYVANPDENNVLVANKNPKIGIAAVECIGIKRVSESKKINNIGVYLRKGSSLALYDNPEHIDANYTKNTIDLNKAIIPTQQAIEPYNKLSKQETLYNQSFVDRDKYAIIHLANLGSWQEGSWLTSRDRFADQYHAKFVIHTYVFGEWNVKPLSITIAEPRPPFQIKKTGLLDFLIPDFNLGILGKIFSGIGWIIVLIIVLSIFFPPLRKLLNVIFSWIVFILPKPRKKQP